MNLRPARFAAAVLLAMTATTWQPRPAAAQDFTVVIRAARVFDGIGNDLGPRDVVVRDGRIQQVAPANSVRGYVYEMEDATILPGFIDTHVHIAWHFDRATDQTHTDRSESGEDAALYAAANAYATLMGGVTTVQSLGAMVDLPLRDAIEKGGVPGPRVLTSGVAVTAGTGDPAAIRAHVNRMADAGVNVIKIFASASIRDGGGPTLSQAQLDAACGQASERGLSSFVHAYDPESVRRVVAAGCTGVEHGALLDRPTLELMAEKGVYLDPNIDLVMRNYFENAEHYIGVGNYSEEGFAQMRAAQPKALAVFQEGLKVSGLKMVFGTDAVAGSHGRNLEELVFHITAGGQDPMDAIVSATSLAAEELGLKDVTGRIAPGFAADLVVVAGDPRQDPTTLLRPLFVMKGGTVYKNSPEGITNPPR